ncbi:iron-sulfur cluster assembly accessory protein [Thiohalobacter sp. IOR34]|uniref:HesB/IscA family protein n=1 Tax=Thiohalobacter sp. IOR34 TaxID=3057176 RepID=UPI0025B1FB56|nr:iron-sulfur cluster assembly accessory protein [Thiohalobacter sp. IOR34]WJW74354.1 iron-sulfur cluster assembly accessory protein [Thiohalobacter sp. IOR34]
MITVTPEAAKQIRESARQNRMEGMPLRVAAQRNADGSIHYGMGFDDVGREDDQRFNSEGIELVVAPPSLPLLEGTTIDYVELEPGSFEFIFINPNDPNCQPPAEADE